MPVSKHRGGRKGGAAHKRWAYQRMESTGSAMRHINGLEKLRLFYLMAGLRAAAKPARWANPFKRSAPKAQLNPLSRSMARITQKDFHHGDRT